MNASPDSKMALRKANGADFEFAYELRKNVMKDYVAQTWGKWDEQFQRDHFKEHFSPGRTDIIVCRGRDIGWMDVDRGAERIYLSKIYLQPQFQRQGIGSQLINRLFEEADGKGLPVGLRVLKINPARRLYERLGFSLSGATETHYEMVRSPDSRKTRHG